MKSFIFRSNCSMKMLVMHHLLQSWLLLLTAALVSSLVVFIVYGPQTVCSISGSHSVNYRQTLESWIYHVQSHWSIATDRFLGSSWCTDKYCSLKSMLVGLMQSLLRCVYRCLEMCKNVCYSMHNSCSFLALVVSQRIPFCDVVWWNG